jgi:hypothetical protein
MRTWKIACGAAIVALGLATGAHADEWNKLTYLTFSAPVSMPGITLPAGTYRFELMDPDSSRRVIRVSDKDGTHQFGIFLSISDRKIEPSDQPVVMFRETAAGIPQAIRAWFYPGETFGYEFVYPHEQAMKIAQATHQPVLAMNESPSSTTEDERVASMRGADVGRIDENGRPVSADEQLKNSSAQRPAATPAATSSLTTTSASSTTTAAAEPPAPPSAPAAPQTSTARTPASTAAAQPTTAPRPTTAQPATAPNVATDRTSSPSTAVGTTGRSSALPRTASPLPAMTLLTFLSLGAAGCVRVARKAIA